MMIRFLMPLLAVVLFVPFPAAATPIDRQSANAYFSQCVANRDQRMTAETQEELCACTSAYMMERLSVEDVAIMREESPRGREALNKMLIEVYGPCMSGPVRDLVLGQCDSDPRIAMADQMVDRRTLCGCMAARTGEWFTRNGTALMGEILRQNPYTDDPITPVMESDVFRKQSYEMMLSCIDSIGSR